MITALGVDLGQGYLLGRPSAIPAAPRPIETLRPGCGPWRRRSLRPIRGGGVPAQPAARRDGLTARVRPATARGATIRA